MERIVTLVLACAAAWAFASALAYSLTQAMVFFPWRIRLQQRALRVALTIAGRIAEVPPDYPRRLLDRDRTRYWTARVLSDLPFCNTCVSFWSHLGAVAGVWIGWGAPGVAWGVSAWLLLPGAVAASWLLWLAVAERLLPQGANALPDSHRVEDRPGQGR